VKPSILVVAVLLTCCLVGCGRGHSAESASDADKKELAESYLRIVARANAAIATFWERANSHGPWTRKQLTSDLAPVIPAYEAADNALLRVHWPPGIRAKVKALVGSNRAVTDLLLTSKRLDTRYVGAFFTVLDQETEESEAAANIVRAELGLPPVHEGALRHKFG
jgi:hypothetical protein